MLPHRLIIIASHHIGAWDLATSLSDSSDKARLQAVRAPHSGDWLNALPLSACGLRLDNNTVHIAVGLRLGANQAALINVIKAPWFRHCS